MIIGIKDGKVIDLCSRDIYKAYPEDKDVLYINHSGMNVKVLDTWNVELNQSNMDSPKREPQKTELELLQEEVNVLKSKMNELIDIINKK